MLEPLIVRGAFGRVGRAWRIERHQLERRACPSRDIDGARRGARIEPEQTVPGGIAERLFSPDIEAEPVAVEGGGARQVGDRDARL